MPVHTDSFVNNYIDKMLPANTNTISRVASFFGSATYTYNNRYVMNFNIRSDGANKFGSNPKYRWLPTWSIAGKWLLTNEGFMSRFSDNGHYISVRGSYGIQEIGIQQVTWTSQRYIVCLILICGGKKRLLGTLQQTFLSGMEGFLVVWMYIKNIPRI